MAATGMTRKELLALPVTVDLRTAAKALSIGYSLAQTTAKAGDFPCQVHKLGRQYRVVTQGPNGLLAACGITDQPTSKGAADAA